MFWQFPFNGVDLGGVPFTPSVNVMMADSGTSMNLIPDEDFDRIMAAHTSDMHCWVMPTTLTGCDCTAEQHAKVPDINFHIDGHKMTIPRDMWFERVGHTCVAKFMHHPGRAYWILGLNFFNMYYTVFDYTNNTIGFAKSRNWGRAIKNSFVAGSIANGGMDPVLLM